MTLPLAIWTTGETVPKAKQSYGNFFRMIKEGVGEGFTGPLLDVVCTEEPTYPDPATVSGIIVSGSPARLNDGNAWMLKTEEELRRAHVAGTPILGICFGHQLVAEALGGTVAPNPQGREIGTAEMTTVAPDEFLDGILAPPIVVMSHLDSVIVAPKNATPLRTTSLEPHAALRFSRERMGNDEQSPNATTWGVQFHPEMNADIVGHYLRARRDSIEAEGLDVDALLAARKDSTFGREVLRRFGRFCATGAFDVAKA